MADYPDSIYSPRTKANRSGVVYDAAKETVIFADDIVNDDNEIVAVETELGLNPRGSYGSVAAYLAALSAKNIFASFIDLINWQGPDAFSSAADGIGDAGFNCPELVLNSGYVLNDNTYAKTLAYYQNLVAAGKLLTVEFQITDLGTTGSFAAWLGAINDQTDPPGDNDYQVGFIIRDSVVYGHCGNGTANTETTTGVTLDQDVQRTRLKLIFNPGTDCKFYVDDVLKCTITTNLPAAYPFRIYTCIKNLSEDVQTIRIARALIEKVY